MKKMLLGAVLITAGCGGGGGDDNPVETCHPKCEKGVYTLYCPISDTCCPNNAPYLCAGSCFEQPCGVGNVGAEVCSQEMTSAFCDH